ncbi:hypothetical protein D9M71_768160 [compost metagenome]
MIAERQASGQRIRDDLNRSVMPERKQKVLPELPKKGALGVMVGLGEWRGGGGASSGSIASPLSEKTVTEEGVTRPDREYWPEGLVSSDGLFVLPAIKTAHFVDANGSEVEVNYANPNPAPVPG